MRGLTVLSVVAASLLLVACSSEPKQETQEKSDVVKKEVETVKPVNKKTLFPKSVELVEKEKAEAKAAAKLAKEKELKEKEELEAAKIAAEKEALDKDKKAKEQLEIDLANLEKDKAKLLAAKKALAEKMGKKLDTKTSKKTDVAVKEEKSVNTEKEKTATKEQEHKQEPKAEKTTTTEKVVKAATAAAAVTAATTASAEVTQKLTHGNKDATVADVIKAALGGSDDSAKKETKEEVATTAAAATAVAVAASSDKKTSSKESSSEDVFDYKLKPKKVAENVWCFFGALDKPTKENAGFMANGCYIKTKDGYLVMDTGPSYQFAKQAYEAMQKIEKLPVKYVVNSHHHDDHWLGNDFYKKKFGATLMGPDSINKNYKEGDKTRMFKILPENAIKGTHIIKLDKVPKEKETLEFGGEKFTIIPMDVKAHTADDVFIYMPERKVLFAGDLVMNGRITSNRDGSVMGQLKALKMMRDLDWKVLIPGHGYITDGTAMDEAEQYFTLTKERVLKALEDGIDSTEITNVVKLEEFKDKKMYDILNAQNVGFAFDELEMLDEE